MIPLSGPLKGIDREEIPQVDLQLAVEQLQNEESTDSEILYQRGQIESLPNETALYSTHEALNAKIVVTTPNIITDRSGSFENLNLKLLVAKEPIYGHRVNVLFRTGCIGNIVSLEFCMRVGTKYWVEPEYVTVIANRKFQEIGAYDFV